MTDDSSEFIEFSKEVAKTLGLSEAILLQTIKNLIFIKSQTDKDENTGIRLEKILRETIFWEEEDVRSFLKSLELKGLVIFEANKQKIFLAPSKEKQKGVDNLKKRIDSTIGKSWQPDAYIIDQASEYGISNSFVLSQVEDFIHLHKEKDDSSYSWGIKFLRFVIKQWRNQEIQDYKKSKRKPMNQTWKPDKEALEILFKAGIDKEFIINEVPEFVLFWSEKGENSDTWNSKFIAQVRRQWAKAQHLIDNSESPKPIEAEWKPSEDFYDVLALTEIDRNFADSVLSEFILYWRETGQAHNSWNSKFIQHVKYQWQKHKGYNQSQPFSDIEQRVKSSWEIKPKTPLTSELNSKEEIQSKLEELKKKHLI